MTTREPDLTDPIDRTHRDCQRAVAWINGLYRKTKERAAQWTPRSCPS